MTMRNTDESTKYRLDAADKICEYHSQRANSKENERISVCIVDNVPNTNESEINEGAIENVLN